MHFYFTRVSIITVYYITAYKWSPTADDAHASANRATSNVVNLELMAARRNYIIIYKFMRIHLRVIVANLSFPEQDSQTDTAVQRWCSAINSKPIALKNYFIRVLYNYIGPHIIPRREKITK